MSLLNQTLQDLHLRNVNNVEIAGGLGVSVTDEDAVPSRWYQVSLWKLFCLLLLASTAWLCFTYLSVQPGQILVEEPREGQGPFEEVPAEGLEKEVPPIVQVQKPEELLQERADIIPKHQDSIDRDLQKAESLLQLNRLSLPANDNALFFVKKALETQPAHEQALALLDAIRQRYIAHLVRAIENNDHTRAQFLYGRFDHFDLPDDQKIQYALRVESMAAMSNSHSVESAWVTMTPASRDQQVLERAKIKINRGQQAQAITELERFLEQYPKSVKSTVFLFDFYFEEYGTARAQQLLDRIDAKHIARTYFSARILAAEDQDNVAISLLQSHQPNEQVFMKHAGLLAGLLQKNQRYDEALPQYKQLRSRFPRNADFLLGAAISADGLGREQEALMDYQQVAAIGHSNPRVSAFVTKRILDLQLNRQDGDR